MDRLAAEGIRFEQAYSAVPLTLPSHASILTGLLPPEHGVRNNGTFRLGDQPQTVATLLEREGYRTAAFVSAFVLDARFGLARGFGVYDDRIQEDLPEGATAEAERPGDRTVAALTRWLDAETPHTDAPFFAWLHLYDPHEPYRPPTPFREQFPDDPYDGEIAFTDSLVGDVLAALVRARLDDRTLVAVIGDHGESLGDHGEEAHSIFVYESAIRVPFILWHGTGLPRGTVVRSPVRETDLAPTVLELLGQTPLQVPHGRSLVPLMRGRAKGDSPAVYAETLLPQLDHGWAPLRAVRDERYKLIEAPRPELYDLKQDPSELKNLHEDQPETAAALRQELRRITGDDWGAMNRETIDGATREKLASLGYVGSSAAANAPFAATGKDPKDAISTFNLIRRASGALRDRRYQEALTGIAEVRSLEPTSGIARMVEASAQLGLMNYAAALRTLEAHVTAHPGQAEAHYLIALCQLRLGRSQQALRETEVVLTLDPHHTNAHVLRGRIMIGAGSLTGALEELRAAVDRQPNNLVVRTALAKALADARRPAEARAEYEAILKVEPRHAPALVGLGLLLGAEADAEGAARLLTAALQEDPSQNLARFALAQIHENQGRTEEAAAEYRRVVESLRRKLQFEPGDAEARLNLARVLDRQGRRADAETEYRRLLATASAPPQAKALARQRLAATGR